MTSNSYKLQNTNLNVAVWGIGYHAQKNILPAISLSSEINLAGVYTRDNAKTTQAVERWKTKSWNSEYDMLQDKSVDAVYVVTPTGLHFEHGMCVLTAGKHLLCEKSLTDCSEKSLQLINYAKKKKLGSS